MRENFNMIHEVYNKLYPGEAEAFDALNEMLKTYKTNRPRALKSRDQDKTKWLESSETVGMMLYVDLFSETLEKLMDKAWYFEKLGITLIHLMPVLNARTGENDGGYAVKDYRSINPKLGDMKTFEKLLKHFHKKGIRICIDYVINHTSDDHEWAQKALAGEMKYQDYYWMYDDDEIPKLFEKDLTEVFPKVAPGNFTFNEQISKFIMTTFYPFQWDLNYTNPFVFNEMVENLLFLANVGVDMIRLDAIPFIWKIQGTDSRNLSEVHDILFLFREIIENVAPSTALLGEAIVQPDTIIKYFGSTERPECHVLYNASYMVEIWNALATRDARHIAQMTSYEIPVESLWINYARCHDDIGWGLESDRIRQLGFDPHAHKMYLIDFYLGILKNSFSIGELYEFNPQTLDARNSGTLASLAGLEKAVAQKDHYQLELALKRIELIHAMFLLRKGIPMLYSGDEWGALNNYSYKLDAEKSHDSRWLHRTKMDWDAVEMLSHQSVNILDHPPLDRRSEVFNRIVSIIRLRKKVYLNKHVCWEVAVQLSNPHILAIKQDVEGSDASILLLFNLSEDRQWIYTSELKRQNIQGIRTEYSQGKVISFEEETILMGPYEYLVV